MARRTTLGIYRFETTIGPFYEPGNYAVTLFTVDGLRFSGSLSIVAKSRKERKRLRRKRKRR